MSISDKLNEKCILNCVIDAKKEKGNIFLCQNNTLVTIKYIIKPKAESIIFIVKLFLNITKFSDKSLSL